MREVDGVGEEVAGDAVAALVELEAPGQQPERVGAVHREEAPAVVGELAELAALDQVGGVAHERRPAVVEADARDDPGAARGALGADGLLRRAADRLLAEHVLAGLGGGLHELDVEHVRRRDEHDLDRRVVDHRAPVGGAAAEAERGHRLVEPRGHRVGADHELRIEPAVGEQRRDPQQRAAVGLAQPAEADHADADAAAGGARGGAGGLHGRAHALAAAARNSMLLRTSWTGPPPAGGSCPVMAVSCSSTSARS